VCCYLSPYIPPPPPFLSISLHPSIHPLSLHPRNLAIKPT
jgi:hypothetical protein